MVESTSLILITTVAVYQDISTECILRVTGFGSRRRHLSALIGTSVSSSCHNCRIYAGIYQSSRSHELGLGTRCAPACPTPLPRSIEQVETVIGKVDYEEDNAGERDGDGGCRIDVVVALSGRAR
jgi:hypothetical protein